VQNSFGNPNHCKVDQPFKEIEGKKFMDKKSSIREATGCQFYLSSIFMAARGKWVWSSKADSLLSINSDFPKIHGILLL
jgi:hypothetical protein